MDDNPNWLRLMDAYGEPYDPRAAIAAIEHGDAEAGIMSYGSGRTIKAI